MEISKQEDLVGKAIQNLCITYHFNTIRRVEIITIFNYTVYLTKMVDTTVKRPGKNWIGMFQADMATKNKIEKDRTRY